MLNGSSAAGQGVSMQIGSFRFPSMRFVTRSRDSKCRQAWLIDAGDRSSVNETAEPTKVGVTMVCARIR